MSLTHHQCSIMCGSDHNLNKKPKKEKPHFVRTIFLYMLHCWHYICHMISSYQAYLYLIQLYLAFWFDYMAPYDVKHNHNSWCFHRKPQIYARFCAIVAASIRSKYQTVFEHMTHIRIALSNVVRRYVVMWVCVHVTKIISKLVQVLTEKCYARLSHQSWIDYNCIGRITCRICSHTSCIRSQLILFNTIGIVERLIIGVSVTWLRPRRWHHRIIIASTFVQKCTWLVSTMALYLFVNVTRNYVFTWRCIVT